MHTHIRQIHMYNHVHNNAHQHIDEHTQTPACKCTHIPLSWGITLQSQPLVLQGKTRFIISFHFFLLRFLSPSLLCFLVQQHVALPRLLCWNHRPHPALWQQPCAFGGVILCVWVCVCAHESVCVYPCQGEKEWKRHKQLWVSVGLNWFCSEVDPG